MCNFNVVHTTSENYNSIIFIYDTMMTGHVALMVVAVVDSVPFAVGSFVFD